MSAITKLAAIGLVLFAVLAADVAWPQQIKVERLEYSAGSIFWLDNNRMLLGTSVPAPEKPGQMMSVALVLDVRNGKTEIKPGVEAHLCYSAGYFRYAREEGDYWVYYGGPFGQEREIRRWRKGDSVPEPKPYFNPLDCREYPIESLPRVNGRIFYPLRPGHGFRTGVDDPKEQQTKSLFLSKTGKVTEISLPTSLTLNAVYSEYMDAYFYELNDVPGRALHDRVWIFRPDADIDVLDMPSGPWASGSRHYYPSKQGWILIATALHPEMKIPFPGFGGIYLVSRDGARRLVSGFPEPLHGAVSPDGCKFAASLQLRVGEHPHVHLINLCNSGE